METAAEREKGWTVGVKTFSATGAANQTGKDDNNDEQNNPGNKDNSDPCLVIGLIESDHHCGKINADHNPQRQTAFPDLL